MTLNDRGARLIALEVVFTLLMTLAVVGRIWSLRILRRSLIAADYFVFVAWAAAVAFNACIIWDCANNFGAPYVDLTPEERVVFAKVLFQASLSWTTATVFCKLSVLFFCLHIFGTITGFRVSCQLLIGLCIAYEVAFIPVFITQCLPPQAAWTGKGKCRTMTTEEIASVSGNLVLDTLVVVLPLPLIWNLQIPTFKKVGLSATFGIGFAIVAVLCWRLYDTLRLEAGKLEPGYGTYLIGMQSTLEVSLGILAACLPTLAPVSTTIIMPAARGILSSMRDRFSSLSLISRHGTNTSRKNSEESSSNDSLWPERSNTAYVEDIPFSGLDVHQRKSVVTSDATAMPTCNQKPNHKAAGTDQIHVFRQVDVDAESVRV